VRWSGRQAPLSGGRTRWDALAVPAGTVHTPPDGAGLDLLVDVENASRTLPLWRRKPVLAFVNHVHTDQWASASAGAVGSADGEEVVMPRVYRRVPFLAISASTADSLVQIGVDPDRISVLNLGSTSRPSVLLGRRPSHFSSVPDGSFRTSGSTSCCACGRRCDR